MVAIVELQGISGTYPVCTPPESQTGTMYVKRAINGSIQCSSRPKGKDSRCEEGTGTDHLNLVSVWTARIDAAADEAHSWSS